MKLNEWQNPAYNDGQAEEVEAPAATQKIIEWRKGHARKFILGGLAFCVAYSKSDKWNSSQDKPLRLLRIKGAALVLGYTGNLDEFRRKPNQPIMRIGNRPTNPDEPKSTVEDLCQEIENVTRILPRNPSLGTHFDLHQAFAQGRLTDDEYLWIMDKVRKLQAQYPTKEAMGMAAEDYAKQIGLVFEGAILESSEEQKLTYSEGLIQRCIDRGMTEADALYLLSLMGAPPPDSMVTDEREEKPEEDSDLFG